MISVVPFVVGFALLGSRPVRERWRSGSLPLLLIVIVVALVGQGGITPSWPDALLGLVAPPLTLAAFGLAIRVAREDDPCRGTGQSDVDFSFLIRGPVGAAGNGNTLRRCDP